MLKFFSSSSFVFVLISSVFLGLSQVSFFGSWMMLELNMLAFLGVLSLTQSSTYPSSLKYFMVQSLGSSAFLFGLLMTLLLSFSSMALSVVSVSLFLKLGAAPLHGWFVSFMSGLDWSLFFVSSTVQKVLPVYLLSMLQSGLLIWVVLASALAGAIGSIGQLSLKKLFAYSSIFSSAWILSCKLNFEASAVYLGVYAFSLLGLITCSLADESSLGSSAIAVNSQVQGGILLVVLLNLGGTPPFMGFFAKVLVISLLASNMEILVVVSLISGSVILLFVYLRMFLSAVTSTGSGGLLQIGMPYPANSWVALLIAAIPVPLWWLRNGVSHKKIWTFSD